jgi:hypothetical protein
MLKGPPAIGMVLPHPGCDKEKKMDARKVAAEFAAYTWFENTQACKANDEAKARFARENWKRFLPIANEGLGRLLIKIGAGRSSKSQRRKRRAQPRLAAAG